MAAPCSLAVAKLFYPETEETKTAIKVDNLKSRNGIFIGNISDDIIHTWLWNNWECHQLMITWLQDIKVEKGDDANVLDAAAKGASTAIMLVGDIFQNIKRVEKQTGWKISFPTYSDSLTLLKVLNIAASLLAFTAFIEMLNNLTMWFAGEKHD